MITVFFVLWQTVFPMLMVRRSVYYSEALGGVEANCEELLQFWMAAIIVASVGRVNTQETQTLEMSKAQY